jgi:ferric iron reductase protein FhuF
VWSAVQVARACGLPWLPVDVGAPPAVADDQGSWLRLRELTEPAAMAAHVDVIRSECDGYRDVATAFLAARFAWPLARMAVVPVVTARRVLLFTPPDLWIRRDDRGLFNAVRVDEVSLATEAGHAGGGQEYVTSAHARAAALAVEGYEPVVDGLRRVGWLGARALWGQLADALVATVGSVLDASADPAGAAAHADLLLRAMDPPLWVRPEFARVERRGAGGLAWRRGSCCLAYRLPWFNLCAGCPLRSRSAWLEATAERGAAE